MVRDSTGVFKGYDAKTDRFQVQPHRAGGLLWGRGFPGDYGVGDSVAYLGNADGTITILGETQDMPAGSSQA